MQRKENYIKFILFSIIMDMSTEQVQKLYLESLSPKEYKAYLIAKDHLGSSFSLLKSVGFLKWKEQKDKNMNV